MLAQRETMKKQRHNKPQDEKTVSQEDAPPAALVKYANELKARAKLEKALAKLKAQMEAAPARHKPRQKRVKTQPPSFSR